MESLAAFLQATAALHPNLCPRQVLGVRMGLYAGVLLGLPLPQTDKRLLTIVETDGCFCDGISASTGCRIGRRTLRVEDMGKAAATFVEVATERALRLSPMPSARRLALQYAPEARDKWEGMLLGYQRIPDEYLFCVADVRLDVPLSKVVSRPGIRVICQRCGEEIMNEREVAMAGKLLCQSCAGHSYYHVATIDGKEHRHFPPNDIQTGIR